MSRQGFILQASIRLSAGLPVLLLYGRLQEGETFLVRDDRQRACFYVRTADGEAVSKLAGPNAKLTEDQSSEPRWGAGESDRAEHAGVDRIAGASAACGGTCDV
jgi:hypothetical protein